MIEQQLLQWTERLLKKSSMKVTINTTYHKHPIDLIATNKQTQEKLFMHIKDKGIHYGHVLNLMNIRKYNNENLNINTGYKYIILSPEGLPGLATYFYNKNKKYLEAYSKKMEVKKALKNYLRSTK